ncbi:MAG: carboxylating nicotinate-nucleotide diphosphorylase [Nitrospira sp.]|nr:carboxylating nicotinate-nucleotide diphosphorylase [Nitrospira sp.]
MSFTPLPPFELDALVKTALREDAPQGDVTTRALLDPALHAQADVVARQNLTLAGVALLHAVYRVLDPAVTVTARFEDGTTLETGQTFATLQGPSHSILGGERVALNFLQHLSGVASLTSRFRAEIRHYPTLLVDTRKTIPGLRRLEKWAVALGGGTNHRMSLSDGVLIKDNHLALLEAQGITLAEACRRARERLSRHFRTCVEVETLEHVAQALDGGADVLLLDNMTPPRVKEAVDLVKGRAHTEVSGGITLQNVREYAATGVDSISIGALTHSAPAVDISMDVRPVCSQ